jgi:hypothetical protein
MKKITFLLTFLLMTTTAYSLDVKLAWDQSSSPEVIGYNIYWGTVSGTYPNKIDVKNVLTYTVTGLTSGAAYYFVATAYNNVGAESSFSNMASYSPFVKPTLMTVTLSPDGRTILFAMSEPCNFGGSTLGWTIEPSGGAATLQSLTGSGTTVLQYQTSRIIYQHETIKVNYTQPGNGVRSVAS